MAIARVTVVLLFWGLAVAAKCSPTAAPANSPDANSENKGVIWVKVDGEGFVGRGNFRLARGSTLMDVVKEAKTSPFSNGRFLVARLVDGRTERFFFRMEKSQEPPLPVFVLREGDFIYGSINQP